MSNSIDQRTVEMVFDNAQFEKGIQDTIGSLDKLDRSLGVSNGGKFSSEIDSVANSVQGIGAAATEVESSQSRIVSALGSFASAFGKVSLVAGGVTAAVGAATAALNFQGGMNRALNLESAKFQLAGLKTAWSDVSDSINEAVQDTAYGLDSAAKAAAQFRASGVNIGEDMTHALRGISGVAAMTNSSYDEIANVFTRIAGNGRVMAVDLNSLGARGLNAAATLADAFNTTEEEVRSMVSRGEIDFQTFADKMDEVFGQHAKEANNTFNGALSNMNAAWSRFWAAFLVPAEDGGGDILNMMRRIFLSVKTFVSDLIKVFAPIMPVVAKISDAIASTAESISAGLSSLFIDQTDENGKKLTAFGDKISKVFINIIEAISSFVTPIANAFMSIMPTFEEIGAWLDNLRLVNFTDRLKLSAGAAAMLESALTGVFAVIKNVVSIIANVVGGVIHVFVSTLIILKDVLDAVFDGIYDFVSRGSEAFSKAFGSMDDKLSAFFDHIRNSEFANSPLVQFLRDIGSLLGELFFTLDEGTYHFRLPDWEKIVDIFGRIRDRVADFLNITSKGFGLDSVFTPISNLFKGIADLFTQQEGIEFIFGGLGRVLSGIVDNVMSAVSFLYDIVSGAILWVSEHAGVILSTVGGIFGGVTDFFGTVLSEIGNVGAAFASGLIPESANALESTVSDTSDTVSKAASKMDDNFDRLSKDIEKNPLEKFIGGIGDAFAGFGQKLSEGAPSLGDWRTFFSGIGRSILDFWTWLDPIGRLSSALETLKKAFEGFGTDDFIGWGSKFLGKDNPWASVLDNLSVGLSNIWKTILEHLPAPEDLQSLFAGLGDKVAWFIDAISPLIEGLGRLVGIIGGKVADFFTGVWSAISNSGVDLSTIGDGFKGLFEGFNEFTKNLAHGDFDFVKSMGDFANGIGDAVTKFADVVFPKTDDLKQGSEDLSSGFTIISDNLSKATEVLSGALAFIGDNLQFIVGALIGGIAFVSALKMVKSLRNLFDSLSGLAGTAKKALSKFAGLPASKTKLQQLTELLLSVVAVVAALVILSSVDQNKLWESLKILGVIAAALAGFMVLFALINNKLPGKDAQSTYAMAAQISAISMALLMASASLVILSLINPDRIAQALAMFGVIMGAFAGIGFILGKFGSGLLSAAAGIFLLGLALLEFAGIIVLYTIIPWGMLIKGIAAVGIGLTAFALVGRYLGKAGPNVAKAAVAILSIAAALVVLTAALIALNLFGGENVIANALILVGLLAVITAVIMILGKAVSSKTLNKKAISRITEAIIGISIAMAILAASLMVMATQDLGNIAVSAISLAGVFAVMAGALYLLFKAVAAPGQGVSQIMGIAQALLMVSVAMGVIGIVLAALASNDIGSIVASFAALAILFAEISLALGILASIELDPSKLLRTAAALLLVSASFIAIAAAMRVMEGVSWESVGQMALMLGILIALSALIGVIAPIGAGLELLAAAMLMIGIAASAMMFTFGLASQMFAESVKTLSENLGPLADAIDEFLGKMHDTIRTRLPEMLDDVVFAFNEFADRAPELTDAMFRATTAVLQGISNAMVQYVPEMGNSILTAIEAAVQWCNANIDRIKDDAMAFGEALGNMIGTAIASIIPLITGVLEGLFGVVSDKIHEIQDFLHESEVNAQQDVVKTMSPTEIENLMSQWSNIDPSKYLTEASKISPNIGTGWITEMQAILREAFDNPELYASLTDMGYDIDAIAAKYEAAGYRIRGTSDAISEASKDAAQSSADSAGSTTESLAETEAENSAIVDSLVAKLSEITGVDISLDTSKLDMSSDNILQDIAGMIGNSEMLEQTFQGLDLDSISITELMTTLGDLQVEMGDTQQAAQELSSEDVAIALAGDIDTDAALAAIETLKSSLSELMSQFDAVNLGAAQGFNGAMLAVSSSADGIQRSCAQMVAAIVITEGKLRNAFSGLNLYSRMYSAGSYAKQGFIDGLNSNQYALDQAVSRIANSVKNLSKQLFEKSPSKLTFGYGAYVTEGFALGITSKIGMLDNAVEDLVDPLKNSMTAAALLTDSIDWDAQPVIRPVLDTGDIENGMRFVNAMFGSSPMMQAAMAVPAGGRVLSNAPASRNISMEINLQYGAGTEAVTIVNDIVNGLADRLDMEG